MRLAQLLGGGVAIAALAVVALRALGPRGSVAEANGSTSRPPPEFPGTSLRGQVDASGIELERLEVRCSPIAAGVGNGVVSARADARGQFEVLGLLDTDYRVEVVSLAQPELVLSRLDFVRPGGDELVVGVDPLALARLRKLSPRE